MIRSASRVKSEFEHLHHAWIKLFGARDLVVACLLLGFPTRGGKFGPEITARYELEGVTDVGEVYEPNVEAIAALQPDLIIGEGYAGDGMNAFVPTGVEEQLQQIAPTVYIDVFRPVEDVMADFAGWSSPIADHWIRRRPPTSQHW